MDPLTIPNKLYGRNREITRLFESFERISSGHGEVLLVPGSSGVGKTALVNELRKPTRNNNGFFVRGKFDQFQQNIPYFAFRQALTELCSELQEDRRHRSQFKAEILQSVGNLGQVLVGFIPEFESFLGVQPTLESISPQEARHRFVNVIHNFLSVICKPEHPLVIFIDDWQWADTASFELIKQIQVGIKLRYLLVIISYRDNEVNSTHPLALTLDDLRNHDVYIEELQVKNINMEDVRELIAETLKPSTENIEGLAAVIHSKTNGNPFFVRSFLTFLYEFELIWFDDLRNCWQWKIDKSAENNLPGDPVALFVLKFRRLDTDRLNLFSLAACLGTNFDMETLSIISGRDPIACRDLLFSDHIKDILQPLDEGGISSPTENFRATQLYSFLHDRIQQAAYSLIEPSKRPNILLQIGRQLVISLQPDQLDERLYEVVNNLNAGYRLIHDITEQVKMVELNISAARKAYAAAAYRSALQFYGSANRFLETSGFADYLWHDHHELALSLFKERAECEFLEGDRHEAEACIHQSVAHAGSALEKADALNILIVHYTLLARYPEAIAAGRLALDALGISLPEKDYEAERNKEIALVRNMVGTRLVSSLVELPVMSNPDMLMASKILITMGPPCYRSHQRLWGVIVPKVVNLTLRFGNIPQIGYSHTAFGGLLGWVDDDYTTAKEFGELATHLMAGTFQSPTYQSVFYLMIGSSIRHWFKHLKFSSQDYADAYEFGLRSGNLQYAAYAFGHNMYCQFYQGIPLERVIQETKHSLDFSRIRLNQWAIDLLEGGLNIFGILSKDELAVNEINSWSEGEYLHTVKDHHNIQVTCIYKILKTFSLLLFGNYKAALALSDETEPLIYTVGTQGLLPWPEHLFARVLILTALYSNADKEQQTKWRQELDPMISRLRIWADNCPENFKHKYLLATAELARIDGRQGEATQLFDMAIEAAQSGNFHQWEGMTNERAYGFWQKLGNDRLAQVYWQQAYVCYDRWGAVAKVRSMEEAYRTYIAENLPPVNGPGKSAKKLEREIKKDLQERQIKQLRNFAFQMQQTKLHVETEAQAEELALAMQRLRIEIVERKRTEQALRESEERFKKLFLEAPLGIALIDSFTGLINEVNPMFAKIAGRTIEEIYQIDLMSITHPDDIQEDLDKMALLNAKKIPGFRMEKRYFPHDGHPVWINMTIAPIDIADKAHPQHLCMIEDITERKQAEKEINLKNEELIKLNTEKDKFFSIIAHDLRGPFSSFLGFTRMIVEDLPSLRLDEIQKIALTMRKSATNLYSLLENLLEWAQLQRGATSFTPASFLLKPKMYENMKSVAEAAQYKEIEISYAFPEDLVVFADENMAGGIIRNLTSNAVKFTPKGGKITIIAKPFPDNFIEISIKDTGIGMSQEMIDNLFRLDENTNRRGTEGEPSTGLGLILCKDFIEKHGGKIWVRSEEGKGSTFTFTLPFKTL
jgi:PAS domain S-box-containing protein